MVLSKIKANKMDLINKIKNKYGMNIWLKEDEKLSYEKYKIIKKQMKNADNETIAILMAINSLSTQLEREIQVEDMEKELEILRAKQLEQLKVKATAQSDDDEEDAWLDSLS